MGMGIPTLDRGGVPSLTNGYGDTYFGQGRGTYPGWRVPTLNDRVPTLMLVPTMARGTYLGQWATYLGQGVPNPNPNSPIQGRYPHQLEYRYPPLAGR